jgi:integrase
MARLRDREGTTARALEFTILTAARSGEARGAKFDEFDLREGIWTVPAERMKSKREHRVTLCKRAVALVKEAAKYHTNDYVFPGSRRGQPLSVYIGEGDSVSDRLKSHS